MKKLYLAVSTTLTPHGIYVIHRLIQKDKVIVTDLLDQFIEWSRIGSQHGNLYHQTIIQFMLANE
jgi:hypothetical protein